MFTNVILTTFLAGLAAAAPALVERQTNSSAFSVIATHSTSAVHLQSVNANGGKFWVGKETSSYCPTEVVEDCPAGTVTAFLAGNGGLSMDTEVPGGQQAYIAADGSLSFTTAHSAYIPPGSQTSPFTYTPQTTNNTVGNLAFGSNGEGFFACPAANSTGVYQIFATTAGNATTVDCIGINLATYTFDGVAAWEYA